MASLYHLTCLALRFVCLAFFQAKRTHQEGIEIERKKEKEGRKEGKEEEEKHYKKKQMASGGQDVQAELQEYLNKKGINTLFIKIVEDLLLNKPDNPIRHVVAFLHAQYPDELAEDAPGGTASGTGPADDDLAFSDDSDEDEEDDDAGELVDLPPKPMPVARSRRVSVSAASTSRDKLRLQWQAKQQEIAKQKASLMMRSCAFEACCKRM